MKKTIIYIALAAIVITGIVAFIATGGIAGNKSYEKSLFPDIEGSGNLVVIKQEKIQSNEELIMVETLQGIVAQEKAQIYVLRNQAASKKWLEELMDKEKVSVTYADNAWDLVEQFRSSIVDNGFVVYKIDDPSLNVACTVSGVKGYVAIEESIVDMAVNNGLVQMEDVRDKDEKWAFDTYKDQLNTGLIMSQPYNNYAFRDYGVATKSLFFYDDNTDNVFEVYTHMEDNGVVMGWYRDEMVGVDISSMLEKITLAADHAHNLSTYASFDSGVMKQKKQQSYKVKSDDVHYVTFMMSDGDNVQWYTNGMLLDRRFFGAKNRGEFPIGWSIPPTLVDLAPIIMEYAYDSQTNNDEFVAGVSGAGYINPGTYDEEAFAEFADITGEYMERADLSYLQILDGGMKQKAVDEFARQEQIEGGFYMVGFRYKEGAGNVMWSNGKPFVAYRDALWDENVEKFAERINNLEKNAKSVNGYSAIVVHAWTHDMADIQKTIELLDDNVVVVSPGEFIELMKENVEH